MIRNGHRGWELVEFARQMPSGKNPVVIERFVYERTDDRGEPQGKAVGYRTEGDREINFRRYLS